MSPTVTQGTLLTLYSLCRGITAPILPLLIGRAVGGRPESRHRRLPPARPGVRRRPGRALLLQRRLLRLVPLLGRGQPGLQVRELRVDARERLALRLQAGGLQ